MSDQAHCADRQKGNNQIQGAIIMSDQAHCADRQKDKACSFASQAAKEAVTDTFAILGVNVHEPSEVEEFRKSLRFGDSMRKAADKGFLALVVVMIGMGAAVFVTGIVAKIKGGG